MSDLPDTLTQLWRASSDGSASLVEVLTEAGVQLAPTVGHAESLVKGPAPRGPTLGRHVLGDELGAGGMGRVIEARDPDLRRTVAVKIVKDAAATTPGRLARFVAEAQITSQLEHPNIVPVHDLGLSEDGEVYFVMKKVEGRSLKQVIRALRAGDEADREHFTQRRMLRMFVQICNAVAYAHDRGVLHRDLKPDNVMIGRFGEILVMDWGVARLLGDRTEELVQGARIQRTTLPDTMDGVAVGTPGYMSPEQAAGNLHELDERTDVWSLGAMLYEMVTWSRAFVGTNLWHLLLQASTSEPDDPRARAPERRVPDDIAEIVLQALSKRREDRPAGVVELGAAVEAFLEGSKRREAAAAHLVDAQRAWARHGELEVLRERLVADEAALSETIPRWAPLDAKQPLLDLRDQLRAVEPARSTAFGDVLGFCEKALSQDPDNSAARAFLADVFVHYFRRAEDRAGEVHFAERVRQYDDLGRYAALLDGTGRVSVRTDPPGAQVVARRFIQGGLVWATEPPIELGPTPLESVALGHGSWVLTLSYPGARDTVYPVHIDRCGRWDGPTIPLYTEAEIGDSWVYVPGGPTVLGGDPLATDALPRTPAVVPGFFARVFPITNAEYCEFLNHLHAAEPGSGSARAPRKESYLQPGALEGATGGGVYWPEPGPGERWRVPPKDDDGDRWEPDWPVFSVTWDDARAYARFEAERLGLPEGAVRLPREDEWDKLARGVDGRCFPWGDELDPALCKMRHSREGNPRPEPVGAFPTDRSVYGARDLAGGVRDLCDEPTFDGDPERRPVRGGSWRSSGSPCRSAYRYGHVWWQLYTSIGFRLVREAPLPASPPWRRP